MSVALIELVEMTATLNVVVSINSTTVMQTYWTAPFLYTINLRIRISWTYFPIFLANFFNSSEIWIVWGQTFSQGLHPIQHSPQKTLCKYPRNSVRTIQRWRKNGTADKRKGSERKITRKLTPEERQKIYPARDLNSHDEITWTWTRRVYQFRQPGKNCYNYIIFL